MSNPIVHAMLLLFVWVPFALLAAYEDRLTPALAHRARKLLTHPFRALHDYRVAHHAPAH